MDYHFLYSNTNLSLQDYTAYSAEVSYKAGSYDMSAIYLVESNKGIYFFDRSISNWSNQIGSTILNN